MSTSAPGRESASDPTLLPHRVGVISGVAYGVTSYLTGALHGAPPHVGTFTMTLVGYMLITAVSMVAAIAAAEWLGDGAVFGFAHTCFAMAQGLVLAGLLCLLLPLTSLLA